MKYFLFIVLLVTVLITAGCIGGNQNSAVTPTQTTSVEPIVGDWVDVMNGVTYSQTFTKDGQYTFQSSASGVKTYTTVGTWEKIRENEYLIKVENNKESYFYNPATDSIAIASSPNVPTYRIGKMPTIQPFTPIILSGSGYSSPKFTIPSDGNYQIDFENIEHDGHDSAFIVFSKSLSSSDNSMDLIYSGFGSKKGSKIIDLRSGSFFLDVTSYGDWSFTISQV